METFIFTTIILFISSIIMSLGVLLFGRSAVSSECGTVPSFSPQEKGSCASGKAGLCPLDDKTGALKMAIKTKITPTPR